MNLKALNVRGGATRLRRPRFRSRDWTARRQLRKLRPTRPEPPCACPSSSACSLAACGTTYEVPAAAAVAAAPAPAASRRGAHRRGLRAGGGAGRRRRARRFCREENPDAPADLVRASSSRSTPTRRCRRTPSRPRASDGRPVIVVGETLLDQMRSDDEIAFVLSHEMSHQIAGHIPKQAQQQATGRDDRRRPGRGRGQRLRRAGLASNAIRQAMDVGAYIGGRTYTQTYELEADTLGAYVAARAGYDPERGAMIFERPGAGHGGGPPLSTPPRLRAALGHHRPGRPPRSAASRPLGLVPTPARAGVV